VGWNEAVAGTTPLTTMLAGRLLEVPLAYPMSSLAVPAALLLIVNWAATPLALLVLQNPVPDHPACSDSMAPSQVAGAFVASYRPATGGVGGRGAVGGAGGRPPPCDPRRPL